MKPDFFTLWVQNLLELDNQNRSLYFNSVQISQLSKEVLVEILRNEFSFHAYNNMSKTGDSKMKRGRKYFRYVTSWLIVSTKECERNQSLCGIRDMGCVKKLEGLRTDFSESAVDVVDCWKYIIVVKISIGLGAAQWDWRQVKCFCKTVRWGEKVRYHTR